jgi:ABC-2 type transport system ATP-binding protein
MTPPTTALAVEARDLVKHYGDVTALNGIDVAVPRGTVTGLLGPNGAGKTTAVKILTTLLRPTSGRAAIEGVDVVRNPARVREVIGLAGQYAAVDEVLTGRQNLQILGGLFHLSRDAATRRAAELLEQFDLVDAADRAVGTYSGGMRRRLDLAASLVHRPPVLFLDEPTTGLDPRSRLALWDVIRDLVRDGTTLLLTTQYLEEADRLANDIVVIDHGRVIAQGSPDHLKARVGGDAVYLRTARSEQSRAALAAIDGLSANPYLDPATGEVSFPVGTEGPAALMEVVRRLDAAGIAVSDIGIRRPSLDDVFLVLTGHAAEEEHQSERAATAAR